MGGKQTKPVIDPNQVSKLLNRWELRSFEDDFRKYSHSSINSSHDSNPARIERHIFLTRCVQPLFGSVLTSTIYDRVFQICDTNGDGVIDWGEWLSWNYLIHYGTRDEKFKFIFNLYDLAGTGKISRREFKKMSIAMMETGDRSQQHIPPIITTAAQAQAHANTLQANEGPGKQFGAMFDLWFYFTLFNYDRDNDRALSFQEWRRYAEEDDTINMVISMLQTKSDLGYVARHDMKSHGEEEEDHMGISATPTPTSRTPTMTPTNQVSRGIPHITTDTSSITSTSTSTSRSSTPAATPTRPISTVKR